MSSYIKIYYRDSDIKTVKALFDAEKIVNIKADEFLDQKSPYNDTKNRDALFGAYTEQQKKDLGLSSAADIKESTNIYPPAILYVTLDKATKDIIKQESVLVEDKKYTAFLDEQMKNIINSADYVKSWAKKGYPNATLFVWSKAGIDPKTQAGYTETDVIGKIYNFTDFIEDMRITVAETGGSFQITLPHIPAHDQSYANENRLDIQRLSWEFDTSLEKKYTNKSGDTERVYKTKVDSRQVTVGSTNDFRIRDKTLPTMLLNVNDIVFIKYERLKIENSGLVNDLTVDPKALNGEVFDMIGLIDSIETSSDPTGQSITISGKDLMKLIIDDGSYFFMNSYSNPKADGGLFANVDESHGDKQNTANKLMNGSGMTGSRFMVIGNIADMSPSLPDARTIGNVVDVVIRMLANIEICPDSLFEAYGDKRTRFRKETVKEKK